MAQLELEDQHFWRLQAIYRKELEPHSTLCLHIITDSKLDLDLTVIDT